MFMGIYIYIYIMCTHMICHRDDICIHMICYRDNGLVIEDKSPPKKCDGIRKRLHRLFGEFGFKLDIQTDLKIADYLDVTLNLYNGTISSFRKRNQDLRYVDRGSNYPKQVFKHISKGIENRLSNNFSNKEIFERSKQEYKEALKNGGYRIKLEYRDREGSNTQKRRIDQEKSYGLIPRITWR